VPAGRAATDSFVVPQAIPQIALLDFFFPGFSVFSSAFHKYLGIDLNLYIPLVLLFGGTTFAWRYFSEYFWGIIETHLMSLKSQGSIPCPARQTVHGAEPAVKASDLPLGVL
jgi:hypothetical protein